MLHSSWSDSVGSGEFGSSDTPLLGLLYSTSSFPVPTPYEKLFVERHDVPSPRPQTRFAQHSLKAILRDRRSAFDRRTPIEPIGETTAMQKYRLWWLVACGLDILGSSRFLPALGNVELTLFPRLPAFGDLLRAIFRLFQICTYLHTDTRPTSTTDL